MSTFPTPLELEYINGRIWRVKQPFTFLYSRVVERIVEGKYQPQSQMEVDTITVPAGMITDFASVPRILWNILPPAGSYGEAAVIHDHLYQCEGIRPTNSGANTRAQSDAILLDGMKALRVGWLTRMLIYLAVRIGGKFAWNADRIEALQMLAAAARFA